MTTDHTWLGLFNQDVEPHPGREALTAESALASELPSTASDYMIVALWHSKQHLLQCVGMTSCLRLHLLVVNMPC